MLLRCVVLAFVAGNFSGVATGGPATGSQVDSGTKTVLVIQASTQGASLFEEFQSAFVDSVRSDPGSSVEIYTEYLDVMSNRSEAYDQAVVEYMRQKYAGRKIDVIVGVSAPAIRFASRLRNTLFPDATLVYGAVDRRVLEDGLVPPGTVGVAVYFDIRETVELALRCNPGTKRVAVVLGATELERSWVPRVRAEVGLADPDLEVVDLAGLPADELLARLSALPSDAIVLWCTFYRDGKGLNYSMRAMIERASAASSVPMYGLFEPALGHGIVGGYLTSHADTGRLTGQAVLNVLRGGSPSQDGVQSTAENRLAFDAHQLERWGIPESRLPAGSDIRYREPSAWEKYGWYIFGGAGVILLQALLIAALLFQSSRRASAQRAVVDQAAFERLVSDLSNRLADASPSEVEAVIATAVESARETFNADRLGLFIFEGVHDVTAVRYSAARFDSSPPGTPIDFDACPEVLDRLRLGKVARIESIDDIVESMPATYSTLVRTDVSSLAAVPLHLAGVVIGGLGVAREARSAQWSGDVIERLRILADLFASALGRRSSAEQLRRSKELSHAVLESVSAQMCVIDRAGDVVAGNDAWQRASTVPGVDVACVLMRRHCGMECEVADHCSSNDSKVAREGIRSVIDGQLPTFTMEYRVTQPTGDAWFVMTAERLRLAEGGAVISNVNVTARKRAELEAEQRRQELTHYSRVSAMGELAASLAHELNQPLTGVLTNAQAALRYLDGESPNVVEVREILGDIIEDDRRAGEVIRRLRSMLQSGSVEPTAVEVNEVVENVAKLVASDAILRDVSIEFDLADGLATVAADRIQLQQVVLNLIVNAMDAMQSQPQRRITVRTQRYDTTSVRVSVSDTGPGIDNDKLGMVFQPFYTSKHDGLGMGLAIARTIIEAHGGVLWASNNPGGGASFHFKLPVTVAKAETA